VRARLGDREGLLGEALSLELATAILFAEQALEDGARPGSDHDRHGHQMARRLGAAFAGDGQADTEMPEWLRSLSRAAQDRMTMIAFVAETGNNLRAVEKTLDAFFRDQSQREGLPGCVRALHQVAGALRLLGHEGAAAGAESVAVRVAALADGDASSADPAGFERIASSVGAIGFFVEGLQRPDRQSGRFEYDEASGDFHAHLTQARVARAGGAVGAVGAAGAGAGGDSGAGGSSGIGAGAGAGAGAVGEEREGAFAQAVTEGASAHASSNASWESLSESSQGAGSRADRDADAAAAADVDASQPSAESVLEMHADEAASLFVALAERPGDAVLRGAMRETLARVRDAAMLLDRADRRHGADEALALLGAPGDVDAARLANALEAAGIALPVAVVPSAPMPADEAAVDSELLEIFLGEAEEVLAAIEEHAALSIATPSDAQYLTTIRRGFHTLKGSSRMVGLMPFGEAGWALEQALNQWLADERPGDEPLYALIDDAVARMAQWVAELRADPASAAAIAPRVLVAHADAVREGRDPAQAMADASEVAAAEAEAAEAAATEAPAQAGAGAAEADALTLAELPGEAAVDAAALEDTADVVEVLGAFEFHEEAFEAPRAEASQTDASLADASLADASLAEALPAEALPADGQEATVEADAIRFFDADVDLGDIEEVELGAVAPAEADNSLSDPQCETFTQPEAFTEQPGAVTSQPAAVTSPPESVELPDVVTIGARELSRQLYTIFLSEADDLIGRLTDDVFAWRANPARGASSDGTRAAHSLKGSSSVVQLDGVHRIAERLEAFMQAQRACSEVPEPAELQVVSDAVERMQAMLHQFAAGAEPRDEPLASRRSPRWAVGARFTPSAPEKGTTTRIPQRPRLPFGEWGGEPAGASFAAPKALAPARRPRRRCSRGGADGRRDRRGPAAGVHRGGRGPAAADRREPAGLAAAARRRVAAAEADAPAAHRQGQRAHGWRDGAGPAGA
jgi:chemosensory pili system protein ChpA (sensor histidine kinase/response regulator)